MAITAGSGGRIQTQPRPAPSGNSMPPDLAALLTAQMVQGGGAAGERPANPLTIRVGKDGTAPLHVDPQGGIHGTRKVSGIKQFSTIDDAVNSFFMMDDGYRDNLMEKLYYYGLTDGPNNEAQAADAWGKVVSMAWQYAQAGKQVDPIDLLPRLTNLKAGQLGGGPRTTTQRQFNTLDPEQAKIFIRQSFQQAMGRDPHDAEIRNLIRGLQQGYSSNPTVMQTTTDGEGNTTQRVVDPGFDEQAYVANRLSSDPEAAAYQAASELFPALQQALQSPV